VASLIHEIQEGASGTEVPTATLLRRMKLAAAKLQLPDLEKWVESELNGYKSEPPQYRIVMASPTAWNPYNGWIPIYSGNKDVMELFSTARITQNISSLEDTLHNHTSGPLTLPMPIGLIEIINKLGNYESARMSYQINRGVLVSILTAVRDMVLDWSIEMEKSGVLGEGKTFNSTEKIYAKEAMTGIKIENFTGILGSNNVAGDINSGTIIISEIEEGLVKLNEAMPALIEAGADAKKLSKALKNIEMEIAKTSPRKVKLSKFYNDANQAIVGASGSLLADGAKLVLSGLAASIGISI
jgi:exonuclease VII small subunit